MEPILALTVGLLVAAGTYLMLSGHVIRFLFGLIMLSNAANLAIFTAGRLTRETPPLIAEGLEAPVGVAANALPQALILTAIVIGFGLLAFALVLVLRGYQVLGTVNGDAMRVAEPAPEPAAAPPPAVSKAPLQPGAPS